MVREVRVDREDPEGREVRVDPVDPVVESVMDRAVSLMGQAVEVAREVRVVRAVRVLGYRKVLGVNQDLFLLLYCFFLLCLLLDDLKIQHYPNLGFGLLLRKRFEPHNLLRHLLHW